MCAPIVDQQKVRRTFAAWDAARKAHDAKWHDIVFNNAPYDRDQLLADAAHLHELLIEFMAAVEGK